MTKAALQQQLASILMRLETQGPSEELELEWIDLRWEIGQLKSKRLKGLFSTWHFIGYLLFDKRQSHGLALLHRFEMFRFETSNRKVQIDDCVGILINAAFLAKSKPDTIRALEYIVSAWDTGRAAEKDRIRKLLANYLEENTGEILSTTMVALALTIFPEVPADLAGKRRSGQDLLDHIDARTK